VVSRASVEADLPATATATVTAAAAAVEPEEPQESLEAPAPPELQRLLSRLELADRLAAGGHGLSLVELAQLVQLPLRSLEQRQGSWVWRDWTVSPAGSGRWRLERGAGGLEPPV
jgi:ribonuclease HI